MSLFSACASNIVHSSFCELHKQPPTSMFKTVQNRALEWEGRKHHFKAYQGNSKQKSSTNHRMQAGL